MSYLQAYYYFKLDFQEVDQHTAGEWLIHSNKCLKDNLLQSLEHPCMATSNCWKIDEMQIYYY